MPSKDFIFRFLASGGFVSYIPARITGFKKFTGSGMAGTLVALALVPILPAGKAEFALFCLAFLPFSVWVADRASKSYGTHDDPRIVIDEIIGYWIAILFVDRCSFDERTVFHLAAAFIFFRALDTLKPWPIKKLETSFRGGFGIIMDDVLAGAEANLLAWLAVLIFL
jgi:phosphatidylglycerophosphatase A